MVFPSKMTPNIYTSHGLNLLNALQWKTPIITESIQYLGFLFWHSVLSVTIIFIECPEAPVDNRCLYDKLEEQKLKKQEEYDEQFKFSRFINRALNKMEHLMVIEVIFLISY